MNSITSREGIKEFQVKITQMAYLQALFSSNHHFYYTLPFFDESCYNKCDNKENNQ
jgi:hypothetical protein